jgi:hypothetical protein
MTLRDLVVRFLCLSAVLAVAELALEHHVQGHYLPETIFETAVAAGDRCVLTIGDSRMVAGTSGGVLRRELERAGSARCVAELAIGGTSTAAHYFAARRYLEQAGRKPRVLVVGTGLATLLAEDHVPDPETFIGNEALVLGWSKVGDVKLFYPGFPFEDFDPGFRFLAGRSSALTAYASLGWARVQAIQNRLVDATAPKRNRFGLLTSMDELAASMRRAVVERLPEFPEKRGVDPWFLRLVELARAHRVPLVVVEVPMPSAYRSALSASPHRERVRDGIRRLVGEAGETYLTPIDSSWVDDRYFDDGVHLGAEGAARFSAELSSALEATPLLR